MEAGAEKVGSTAPGATGEGEGRNGVEGGGGKDDEGLSRDLVSKSEVETAGPRDACLISDSGKSAYPLSLVWSLGFNRSLPIHNVSDGSRKMLFYVCGHMGVLYDGEANQQCLLQGHGNLITCTAVSGDRRWLVTADAGPGSMLTVWDSYSALFSIASSPGFPTFYGGHAKKFLVVAAEKSWESWGRGYILPFIKYTTFSSIPVQTYFKGLGNGCRAVAMSQDARYVATLTMGPPQVVSVWEWTTESDTPFCHTTLSTDYGQQTHLAFREEDPTQLVSSSEDQVVFYSWHGAVLRAHSTPVTDKDFSKPVGTLSQSVFLPHSTRALTGTSEGCGVIWDDLNPPTPDSPHPGTHVKKPVKLLSLHDSPITVATIAKDLLVTGDRAGCVKFYDSDLKLLQCYDALKLGPLASISFAYSPKLGLSGGHQYPPDSTMSANPFVIPDFVVSTTTASIAYVTTNGSTTEVIFHEHDAAVNALGAHPHEPRLLVGSYSCKLKLWDYERKEVLAVRQFEENNYVQCVTFDPRGDIIGVGFTNGVVCVLDALTLAEVSPPFRYARDCITHIAFSHDSQYMATADADLCVTVYVAQPEGQLWQFLAKHRAHYKQIEGLVFGVMLDSTAPRLLSIGRDRSLVEYDLASSSVDDLVLLSVDRIEQSAVPTSITWYPPLTKESFILLANNQYKLKLYNSTTNMCRRTLLGPVFGSPLTKMAVLPAPIIYSESGDEMRRYLAYTTTDKVGLLLLPHDGNPHNSKGLIAHPTGVADMVCSHDGRFIFTAGGEDCTVSMWSTNIEALESASLLGGKDLTPFYSMLEGGREGEFFAELEDYFYYAQIRSQGPDTTSTRQVATTIPLEQIPYVMRAIGFYPSEQEIEDMLNEVKFSKYVDTGKYVTAVDLGDFIKLYINHRPVFGLSPDQLAQAFHVLGERQGGQQQWSLDRAKLLSVLQEKGEHVTEEELVEHLMTLLGHSENPEVDGTFSTQPEAALQELPEKITVTQFAEDLLGLTT